MYNHAVLHALTRELLASGKLPYESPRETFGGDGSGEPCALCGETIERSHTEIEAVYRGGALHFHVDCNNAWWSAR